MKNKNEILIRIDLRVTTFNSPPKGFNPLTAPQSKLRQHGIFPRPDKRRETESYHMWHKIFSKKINYIIPEFSILDLSGQVNGPILAQPTDPSIPSSYYAGAYSALTSDKKEGLIKSIAATWEVPDPQLPTNHLEGQSYKSEIRMLFGKVGETDGLFAGTSQEVRDFLWWGISPKYFSAFWKTNWAGPTYKIDNFPVSAGDHITCIIGSRHNPPGGAYNFYNHEKNNYVTFSVNSAPINIATIAGWFLFPTGPLPKLNNFEFEDASATTTKNFRIGPKNSFDYYDTNSNKEIATAKIIAPFKILITCNP